MLTNVCFEGNNGHDVDVTRCLLMTQSRQVWAVFKGFEDAEESGSRIQTGF